MTQTTKLPTVYARSMIAAQGVTLDAETKAIMRAAASRKREVQGVTHAVEVQLEVRDYSEVLIGHLVYRL